MSKEAVERSKNRFNEEEVKKRLREDGYSGDGQCFWNVIQDIHPDLYPIIESWLKGEHPDFEFGGITIYRLMKRQHITYMEAISQMKIFLKRPDILKWYIEAGEPFLYYEE